MNLANNSAFPAATVSTSQALDSVQIRTTVDNNENTCYQFNGREEWMRIWLGENANVGTVTITSTTPGKYDIYHLQIHVYYTSNFTEAFFLAIRLLDK